MGDGMQGTDRDYPSTIGSAIADMKMKRAMIPQPDSSPSKRRKIDSPVPRTSSAAQQAPAPSPMKQVPSQQQPLAGPSRFRSAMQQKHLHVDELSRLTLHQTKRPRLEHAPQSIGHPSSSKQTVRLNPQVPLKRPPECIEISSDEEVANLLATAKKKPKVQTTSKTPIVISSDSEEDDVLLIQNEGRNASVLLEPKLEHKTPDYDYSGDSEDNDDWNPPGFDLNDHNTWKPLDVHHDVYLTGKLAKSLERLDITAPKPYTVRYIPPDVTKFDPVLPRRNYIRLSNNIWDTLAQTTDVRIPPRLRPIGYQIARPYIPPWREDFDFYRMTRTFNDPNGFYELRKAPGSINKVVQKGNWAVIASGCTGGLPDASNEEPSPYNREGSLMTLRDQLDIPKGHEARKSQPSYTKHYAVNDIQFDPMRKAFVSTGADHRVRFWTLQHDDDEEEEEDPNISKKEDIAFLKPQWKNKSLKPYKHVPHDLAFKPSTSILAVAEKQVRLYSLAQAVPEPLGLFPLHVPEAPHIVGAMAWGMGPTSNHLFASSEPLEVTRLVGVHKAFDIQEKRIVYAFDAKEAGDTLSIGPTGRNLALSTRGPGNRHILRLYDISRRNGNASLTVDLEPFAVRYQGFEGEVNESSFSPDGLLLALARNDNQTHVYDLRFMHRGPIYQYEHFGECQASNKNSLYGIVKAQWLHSMRSRRVALVTGGEDGCVRVWDTNLSASDPNNAVAIAKVNSDIGHFSLGDPFAGEHQLIVGDCSGEITVFDNVGTRI